MLPVIESMLDRFTIFVLMQSYMGLTPRDPDCFIMAFLDKAEQVTWQIINLRNVSLQFDSLGGEFQQ